jgi:predicted glycosyltransferase
VKIWVDLVNSPQVLVLKPVVDELARRGHELLVTTRDFAQTVQLADRAGLRHVSLGRHGGNRRSRSILVNLQRVALVASHVRGQGVDLALSHNSYSQAVAARILGIPFVTMMDYEHHRANHLAFRLARRVLVPAVFPDAALAAFGASKKTVRYPGLKEQMYLGQFTPDPDFPRAIGLPADRPVVVARPPGTWAAYYHGRGKLFAAFLQRAMTHPSAFLVFLPRIPAQEDIVRGAAPDRVLVPSRALDGPNLLYYADLAVSGGGTMNREAAVLGTPAYSVFEGPAAAVDRELASAGRLTIVQSSADVEHIAIAKKSQSRCQLAGARELTKFVVDAILESG